MPHKHKRDKGKNDADYYDLAPSKVAQSLPVKKTANTPGTDTQFKSSKRKRGQLSDDTPRAFTRLLAAYRPPRSGLDDGNQKSKKRKISSAGTEQQKVALHPPSSVPTIQLHEPLSAFNARVDAALPFSGLSKRSGGGKDTEKVRKTKAERRMQKMQKEWREEDQRRKEKLKEAEDEAGVNEDGIDELLRSEKRKQTGGKGKKGGAKTRAEIDKEDPWAHIKAKRIEAGNEQTTGGLIGLHDVVLAPPKFTKAPKSKQGVGGLKRQVELSEARKSVVEGYRQLMKGKREHED